MLARATTRAMTKRIDRETPDLEWIPGLGPSSRLFWARRLSSFVSSSTVKSKQLSLSPLATLNVSRTNRHALITRPCLHV